MSVLAWLKDTGRYGHMQGQVKATGNWRAVAQLDGYAGVTRGLK